MFIPTTLDKRIVAVVPLPSEIAEQLLVSGFRIQVPGAHGRDE